MAKKHYYRTTLEWTGNMGKGTENYQSYSRNHVLSAPGKIAAITGSSDPAFRGDPKHHSPEDLLLHSLAACHMLWYLHLCSVNGIVVMGYRDVPTGAMEEEENGAGQFVLVTLHPVVTVVDEDMVKRAMALHEEARRYCFIARSVNFTVGCMAEVKVR